MSVNDLPVGRNVDEYLRLVKVYIILYYRHSNMLLNMVKYVLLHGLQVPELWLLDLKINLMLIGKKFMVKNESIEFIYDLNHVFYLN